jgi:two-component system phosphate regulon sensor histidine kinase PhoR
VQIFWPTLAFLFAAGGGIVFLRERHRHRHLADSWQTRLREIELKHQSEATGNRMQQQALFDSMGEGFLLLDEAGKIVLTNQALHRLFGITSELRGLTVLEAFRWPELHTLARKLERERQLAGFELHLPGLEEKLLEVNASIVSMGNGRPKGSVFVFHDLTRLKQLENTRQEFVANVSHELRTPLSLIKGYVETLLDGAKDNPEVSVKFLQTIERHADRLTFLIEDLLTISKIESGQIALNLQSFALQPVVGKLLEELESPAAQKKAQLTNTVPSDCWVRADSERVQQVLSNLIVNAIKYGRLEGAIVVRARELGDKIEVSVEDNGPGIPPEALERVFERFYRVDKARSREQGGTGLGLSIVKHIVQHHGGEVWARSELGKGSTFRFTLPSSKPAA